MGYFAQLQTDFKRIDAYSIIQDILSDPKIQQFILDLPKDRIQSTGIAGDGTQMQTDRSSSDEAYSDLSNILKESNTGIAGITDHVTLTESGDFWKSQIIKIGTKSFFTEADFIKKEGHMGRNFTQDFGSIKDFEEAVLKLTDEDLNKLVEKYIYPNFIKHLKKIIT